VTWVIHTEHLTKDYGAGKGCQDISLSIKGGQIFGFLGPNGAGKSTFVKLLVGLLHHTSGKAQVLGLPLGHIEARKQIGYLPELFRYQEWLTGEEVLRFHTKLAKLPTGNREFRIREILHEVGLGTRGKERVKSYSKGMQQRLGLGCALLAEPKLIFLDEPSSALDPGGRYEVRKLLLSLKEQGKTVFLNTHMLEDVEAICDEVALLFNGQIREVGTVNSILHKAPAYQFSVGGYLPESLQSVLETSRIPIQLKGATPEGKALLEASVTDPEQVGWLNYLLQENGFTLYEVRPVETHLEQWFLNLTEERSALL
jgi:ABC-2 type transport system ATP-binding protein